MATVQMTLELPEELVRDAQEFGLLTEDAIAELLRQEIDQRVMALVNQEIHDYRAEKRKTDKLTPSSFAPSLLPD